MADGNGSDRISVSRDALRAELSDLELRLVDRITVAVHAKADQQEVDGLVHRIAALELSRAERAHLSTDVSDLSSRTTRLEKFRYGIPSVGLVSLAATLVLILTHHA